MSSGNDPGEGYFPSPPQRENTIRESLWGGEGQKIPSPSSFPEVIPWGHSLTELAQGMVRCADPLSVISSNAWHSVWSRVVQFLKILKNQVTLTDCYTWYQIIFYVKIQHVGSAHLTIPWANSVREWPQGMTSRNEPWGDIFPSPPQDHLRNTSVEKIRSMNRSEVVRNKKFPPLAYSLRSFPEVIPWPN